MDELLKKARKASASSANESSQSSADAPDASCRAPKSLDEAMCFALRVPGHAGGKGRRTDAPFGLAPADLLSAYDLPANGGAGRTVAIVDAYDNPSAAADLAVYRAQFGLPPLADGQFTKVNQDGRQDNYPRLSPEWAQEISLDIDMVTAIAPKAKILLVEADSAEFDDLGQSVNTAVALGATYVSNSYGTAYKSSARVAEASWQLDTAHKYYEHPGVALVASAGDANYGISFPAVAPGVTAVAGTSLTRDPSTTRGWNESVWASDLSYEHVGTGSGCSTIEPKPSFQKDTGCAHRTVADVAAVADPLTPVAVYDSFGSGGWTAFGGTSASSPIIAGTYALAGPVAAGTHPNGYPYANPHLNDVISGHNGNCFPTYLCNATVGYDGPSGLGTPNGTAAFRHATTGALGGTVTDSTHKPRAGLRVTLLDDKGRAAYSTATDAKGAYRLNVSPGIYRASVSLYPYTTATGRATVTAGKSTSTNLVLVKRALRTVSGKVSDGSGRGSPLYAKITFDGIPGGTVYTDPRTGLYSASVAGGSAYTVHVTPIYPGYTAPTAAKVQVGTGDVRHDVSVLMDKSTCTAPGYGYAVQADFDDWTTEARYGWTTSRAAGTTHGWEFDRPGGLGNSTGSNGATVPGNFATAAPYLVGGGPQDTSLISPSFDLSGPASTDLRFDRLTLDADGAPVTLDADISVDGGTTWTTAYHTEDPFAYGPVDVPLAQWSGRHDVRLRFHFAGGADSLAQVDNIAVGQCTTLGGGIVTGTVRDANTGQSISGATVTDLSVPAAYPYRASVTGSQAAGGFYWLYSRSAGRDIVRVKVPRYATTTQDVPVSTGVHDYSPRLRSAQLKVTVGKVALGAGLNGTARQNVTLTNTGGEPLKVMVHEQSQVPSQATPGVAGPWHYIPDYPEPVIDNVLGSYQGKLYSVGGSDEQQYTYADSYVYAPGATAWSRIAPLPEARNQSAGAFVNDVLYVAGGYHYDSDGDPSPTSTTFAYHPGTDTWSRVADRPEALSGGAPAVLGGQLYIIGGVSMTGPAASPVATSYRYDPAHDSWHRIADYPIPTIAFSGCGGLDGTVVCAGGDRVNASGHTENLADTYVYHPSTDTWTRAADMPYSVYGAQYSAANGRLQVVSGNFPGTDSAVQYDPLTGTWADLPNTVRTVERAQISTGCGTAQIGGNAWGYGSYGAAVLPGFDQCDGDDVNWLSVDKKQIILAPGRSTRIEVTGDARVLTAPGGYAATLFMEDNSPYVNRPVPVTLKAAAPASYAEITGTIALGARARLGGAKVTLTRAGKTLVTTTADSQGRYDVWVPAATQKTTVAVSHEGYSSRGKAVTTEAGHRTTADFAFPTG